MIDEKKLILHLNDWMLQESFLRYMKNPADTIAECIKAVEEQPKIGGWIPCSERLPEKSNWYLVTECIDETEDNTAISEVCTEVFWTKDNKWDCERDYYCGWKIIAWQPLPEAYHG